MRCARPGKSGTEHPARSVTRVEPDAARGWLHAERVLWGLVLLTGALNMLEIRGGFLTSHLADLVIPALLYIHLRGLCGHPLRRLVPRRVRQSSFALAGVIFLASAVTEVSQVFWPRGIFRGYFDPLDLVAFAAGIAACLVVETYLASRRRAHTLIKDVPDGSQVRIQVVE